LEDLRWSDYATLDLLTYLARRAGPARLLLLGTYRPVEVALRGHPLQSVKRDLILHGQAVELPLELLTAAEGAQYPALPFAGGAGGGGGAGAGVRRGGGPAAPRPRAGPAHLPAHGWPSTLSGDRGGALAAAGGAAAGGRAGGGAARGGRGGPGGAGECARDDRA